VVDGEFSALDTLAKDKQDVAVLVTVKFHERSRDEVKRRYDASTAVPEDVTAFEIAGAGETIYWLPEHRTLVPGDRILGDRPPGLRMCPESWLRHLGGYTQDDLRVGLRPLLDLPVELLVSHGELRARWARGARRASNERLLPSSVACAQPSPQKWSRRAPRT
jgi:hypothetical protein